MFFYKAPRDDRGWTYVGLLCRLAVEIGLDRTPVEDVQGHSEHAHRERRNRVRTWMLYVRAHFSSDDGAERVIKGVHDGSRRLIHHWTRSIPPRTAIWITRRGLPQIGVCEATTGLYKTHANSRNTRRDYTESGSLPESRNFVESLQVLGLILSPAAADIVQSNALDHLSRKSSSSEGCRDHKWDVGRYLLTVNYDLDEWRTFWQSELSRHHSPERYWAYLRFFELHIRLTLNSFAVNARQLLRPTPNASSSEANVTAEQYCYSLAKDNLLQLQTIRALDVSFLQHARDSISIMVAYAACFLRALVNGPNISDVQRNEAMDLIHLTSEMFKTVSRDQETTATMQVEFLNGLFAQTGPSRPLSQTIAQGLSSWDVPPLVGDPTPSSAPHIDISDFGAWLSAFEMDTLPDAVQNHHWGGVPDLPDGVTVNDTAPLANNNDWDGDLPVVVEPGLLVLTGLHFCITTISVVTGASHLQHASGQSIPMCIQQLANCEK